jgi:hypothetical protein
MAWVIESEKTFEDKHVEILGRAEFDRRQAVANAKADELTEWREQMFMRLHFVSIAMQLNPTQFATAEGWSGDRWAKLVYKLAK